jgi:hypothetical protein
MPHKSISKRASRIGVQERRIIDGKSVKRFEPGFYSDGEAVYVDMNEFLKIYGICDVPEIRAVLWADIVGAFGNVPVLELGANTPTVPPRRRSALN